MLLGAHYATSLYNLHVRSANSVAHKEQKDAARAARKAGEEYDMPEGPKFSGVESLCDWASLELSTELLDHCRRAQHQKRQARNVFCAKTCHKVPLTAHHLCALSDGLCDLGYTAQALAPTVCLQLVGYLATTHEQVPALAVLGGCRRARLLLELGATQAALKQLRALGGLGLTAQNEAEAPDATDVERLLEQRKTTEPVKQSRRPRSGRFEDWKLDISGAPSPRNVYHWSSPRPPRRTSRARTSTTTRSTIGRGPGGAPRLPHT